MRTYITPTKFNWWSPDICDTCIKCLEGKQHYFNNIGKLPFQIMSDMLNLEIPYQAKMHVLAFTPKMYFCLCFNISCTFRFFHLIVHFIVNWGPFAMFKIIKKKKNSIGCNTYRHHTKKDRLPVPVTTVTTYTIATSKHIFVNPICFFFRNFPFSYAGNIRKTQTASTPTHKFFYNIRLCLTPQNE